MTLVAYLPAVVTCICPVASLAATSALHPIFSEESWAAQGGACSGPHGIYERQLSPDVMMRLFPCPRPSLPLAGTALELSFIIGDGHRVRLASQDLSVAMDGGVAKQARIATFRSLKEEFNGDQELIGSGRFAQDSSVEEIVVDLAAVRAAQVGPRSQSSGSRCALSRKFWMTSSCEASRGCISWTRVWRRGRRRRCLDGVDASCSDGSSHRGRRFVGSSVGRSSRRPTLAAPTG